jgi:molybdopterin molybdotransferase
MISVEEARTLIAAHQRTLPAQPTSLSEAAGGYLLEDIHSDHDHPLFDMSAVDGYAFAFRTDATDFKVVGEVAAGAFHPVALAPGECVRIFTGAMVPEGADTVVMQERTSRDGDRMAYVDPALREGSNVRKRGEQIRAGETVIRAGVRITPAVIGLLASIGKQHVHTSRRPRIGVVITGSEFMESGALVTGRIFNSNNAMLAALLQQEGADVELHRAADEPDALERTLDALARTCDLLVTTGGASVGDHDLLAPSLRKLGAPIVFHGIAQKPGKPMLFAMLKDVPVFALPGNPRAVLICAWEYVIPYLRAMQGAQQPLLEQDRLPLSHAVEVKGNRAEFRAARVSEGRVRLLADEGSHMLRSFMEANAIVYLPEQQRRWETNATVEVHHLPAP